MKECEYLQLVSLLEGLTNLIIRKDWEGLIHFIDGLRCLDSSNGHYNSSIECESLQQIKDIASHMEAIKTITLNKVVIISEESMTKH